MTFKSLAETNNEIYPETFTATFAAAGTRGSVVALGYRTPIRLLVGAGWAGTATQVRPYRSEDGVTYRPVYDQYGTAVAISAVAGRDVELDANLLKRTAYLRLLGAEASGTAAAQSTACTVTVIAGLV
jgi:hypothetical protein